MLGIVTTAGSYFSVGPRLPVRMGSVLLMVFAALAVVGQAPPATAPLQVPSPQADEQNLLVPPGSTDPARGLNTLTADEQAQGWRQIFNGRDLTGWIARPSYQSKPVKWEVIDGVIRGTGQPGYLCTTETFADFEIALEARVWDTRPDGKGHGNSGVKVRCQPPLPYPAEFYPFSYEIQIDNQDKRNPTGSIYDVIPAKVCRTKDRDWIDLRARVRGFHFQVWVNGELVTDGQDPQGKHRRGFVALQMHHSSNVVEFRNVRLRELR